MHIKKEENDRLLKLDISRASSIEENSRKEISECLVNKALIPIVSTGIKKIDTNQKLDTQIIQAAQILEKGNLDRTKDKDIYH